MLKVWLLAAVWLHRLAMGASMESSEAGSVLQIAQRTQRDISQNATLDQLTYMGIDLNKVLWDSSGYKTSTLTNITAYLTAGVNLLMMDLYWNENWQNWQLCPEPLLPNVTDFTQVQDLGDYECELGLNLTVVFDTIQSYFDGTNTDFEVDILELVFQVRSLRSNHKYGGVGKGNHTLSNLITQSFGAIYTPADLQDDVEAGEVEKGEFPTLSYFLYEKYKRVITLVSSNELQANSTYGDLDEVDDRVVFIDGYSTDVTTLEIDDDTDVSVSDVDQLAAEMYRLAIDNSSFGISEMQTYIRAGYSYVAASTEFAGHNITEVMGHALWTWLYDQPDNSKSVYYSNETNSNTRQVANKCAVYYERGWAVENCYNTRFIACRNSTDEFDWMVTTTRHTYFGASCPTGYSFYAPRNSLQSRALRLQVESQGVTEPVWIDMNSISVTGCWVTGGPYATCPYESVVTKKLFVGMISPAAVVTFLLVVGILSTKFNSVPLQQNRKHWKKLVNEINEKDYDGVPS